MATTSGSTDEAMHEREPYVTHPMDHVPRLVLSRHVSGDRLLDRVADFVNRLIGSMYLFVAITFGIVVWLFAGNIVGFDKTPWPLLLTLLNLPQLSIMISLQVSANRALAASDARAIADHETLHAIHVEQDADPDPRRPEPGARTPQAGERPAPALSSASLSRS